VNHFHHAKRFVKSLDEWMKHPPVCTTAKQLAVAANLLLDEFERIRMDAEAVIWDDITLPADLASDFLTARSLLSVGFDEAAVIYAGRGLEGVLRSIARRHSLLMRNGSPAWEARFADILTRMQELRITQTHERLLDPATANLLQYGRSTRNQVAHPPQGSSTPKYQEQAVLMAHKAGELWCRCMAQGVTFT
jgi:hypothetical protein